MGTRNLTMVISGGETKVAQYGQLDGYPGGVGSSILEFLKKADLDKFKEQLKSINWLTKEQIDTVNATKNWDEIYPYLSRDAADDVLGAIHYGKMTVRVPGSYTERKEIDVSVIGLQDASNFGGDSLFCEWAYVIDLDNMKFEVYEGFNKEPVPETNRFYGMDEGEYKPVKLIQTFDLNNLPDDNEFLQKTDPQEEETT